MYKTRAYHKIYFKGIRKTYIFKIYLKEIHLIKYLEGKSIP